MSIKGWSLVEGLERIRAKRKKVRPNASFLAQLRLHEKYLMKHRSDHYPQSLIDENKNDPEKIMFSDATA